LAALRRRADSESRTHNSRSAALPSVAQRIFCETVISAMRA